MHAWGVIYEGGSVEEYDSKQEAAARREVLVSEALAEDPDFPPDEYTVEQVCKHGYPIDDCQDGCDDDED